MTLGGSLGIASVAVDPSLSCTHADTASAAIRPSAIRAARKIPPRFTPPAVTRSEG